MSIVVSCPECGTQRKVADHMSGKSVRCRNCDARIRVSPPRKKKKKSRKAAPRPAAGKPNTTIGVVIGGILGLCVVGGIAMFLFGGGGSESADSTTPTSNEGVASTTSPPATSSADSETAETNSAANSSQPTPSGSPQVGSLTDTTVAANSTPTSDSMNSTTITDPSPAPASPAGGFQPSSTPASTGSGFQSGSGDELKFTRSDTWTVTVDKPANAPETESTKPLRVRLTNDNLRSRGVVFPMTASPFAAFKTGTFGKFKYEVRDCSSNRKVGEFPVSSSIQNVALSSDASYIAAADYKQVEVFDLKAKKTLGSLQMAEGGATFNLSELALWKHRLVAMSTVSQDIRVWELPSGNLTQSIKPGDKFRSSDGHAFSPNGRYVAVNGEFLEKRVDIFDLETGQLAGFITPEGKPRISKLESLGFSRDGSQLAVIWSTADNSRMVTWDVAAGEIIKNFELEIRLEEELKPVYQSHELESLPGNTRWLAHSLGIVDTESEQLIFQFPKQDKVNLFPSRRVLNGEQIVAVMASGGDPSLQLISVSAADLDAGAKATAAGGFASDAKLPPLTPVNPSSAADGIASTQWEGTADPLTATSMSGKIRVNTKGTVREVAISRSANPVYVTRAGIQENRDDLQSRAATLTAEMMKKQGLEFLGADFDKQPVAKATELLTFATDGAETARITLPYSAALQSVSPDGRMALLEEHRTNGRLDVYQLTAAGTHVCAWRPFRDADDQKHREVRVAEFITNDLVATVSKNNALMVWKVPSLEAVWKLDKTRGILVSPGGRYLLVVRGSVISTDSLDLFDAQTGQGLGSFPVEGKFHSAAFHPDGSLLAVSMSTEADKMLTVVDMTTGLALEEFPLPVHASTLAWTGQDHLLLNGSQLVSRPLQAVVWSYTTASGLLPSYQVSEKFCFAKAVGRTITLESASVPRDAERAKFSGESLSEKALLKPGDVVQLSVQVDNNPLLASLKTQAEGMITERLQAVGMSVDASSNVALEVTVGMKDEGVTELSRIGDRSLKESVMRKTVLLNFIYTSRGKQVWRSSRRVSNLTGFLVRLEAGKPAQVTIDENMQKSAEGSLRIMKLPRFIFGEEASKGLGTSVLGG